VGKEMYGNLDAGQRALFDRAIPMALKAFVVQDFDIWPEIITRAGIKKARDIVEDSRRAPGTGLLVRDFSGVERLIREVGAESVLEGIR